MNALTKVIVGAAVVGLAGGGWLAAKVVYLDPAAALTKEAAALRDRVAAFDAASKGARENKIALRDLASTMLGGDQVVVEHRLRGLLSELAESCGLGEIVVTHGKPRPQDNPAQERGSEVNRTLRRLLADRQDFAVVQARVQGDGTLEQVSRLLAAVRAQPWIHRVEGVGLAPKGRDRRVYELRVDLATVFAPDLVAADAEAPVLTAASDRDLSLVSGLVAREPFRLAEPVAVAETPPPPLPPAAPKPKPGPPYDKWRVTGVLETRGPSGVSVEVMLARSDTGEFRTLVPGDSVLGAQLEGAAGEAARFVVDGRRVLVRTGQSLAQGEPAESVHSEAPPPPHG
jgi:hypothetical protein